MKDDGGLSRRRLKEISSLSMRKYREASKQTLVEGARSIQAAVAGGVDLIEVLITEKAGGRKAALELVGKDTPIFVVPAKDFDRVSDVRSSQGLLAVARFEWAPTTALRECRRIIALDAVQDPGNVGTIIRGAAWMGVEAVLCGAGTADAFSPKAVRASMGGVWDVVLVRADDLAGALTDLKGSGHSIASADLGGDSVTTWSPSPRTILVLGNEGSGVSADVGALADEVVTVFSDPKAKATESLNVAMAAAIMMHNWTSK
ncbi:MAG: RNA methyltransferase [Rhodothermia bacterium]|nr:RNA methyltransferase [Rhodothermia bacterium]